MNTELLYQWASFHNMGNLEKRELFTQLIKERLRISCEAHIYRVLARLTFQTLRKKYGEMYQFSKDEEKFASLMKELGLSSSTVLNWYYSTSRKNSFKLLENECADLPTRNICECCISDEVRKRMVNNYEFKLASKRLYQTIVRAELFKERLCNAGIELDEDSLRKILRRLVEFDYYQKRRKKEVQLQEVDLQIQKLLKEINVKSITVLKWFYLIRHHPELLKKVYSGEINPDDIFEKSTVKLMKDLRGGYHATNSNVCQ